MFEQLLAAIIDKFWLFSPFIVINQYENGVVLRLGVYNRTIEPGWRWKLPGVDNVLITVVTQSTLNAQSQTIETKDSKSVTISAIIQYEIYDARAYLLDVWEGQDAVLDNILAAVELHVGQSNWNDVDSQELNKMVLKTIRKRVRKYGVRVKWLAFADRTRAKALRLMGDY